MIELDNISKNFGPNKVIKNLSLKIKEGEVVGFLGPNGAGKTTTVRMITGVLPPSKGRVSVNGVDLFSEDITTRPHIGYLPENNPIYDDMTVEEFLKMWSCLKEIESSKIDDLISEAVESAGLQDVFYRPISELSKGYRQRTGLAQAILSKPEILLLDEPTEGLDPNQRNDIHKLIKGLGKKRTVIICSHVLPEITKMCDRVVIINKGKIVADSPTSDLGKLTSGGTVYELLATGANILKELKTLPKVIGVEKEKDDVATKWIITSESKKDLRLNIFEMAKNNNWKLYELAKKQFDLEDIFTRVTKE